MTDQTTRPAGDITAGDFFLSLNGYDELAIARAFGTDIADLRDSPMRFLRALAFVHQRRAGAKDADAYKAAMNLSISATGEYFADDEDEATELDPDDPVSDEGKDDALSG